MVQTQQKSALSIGGYRVTIQRIHPKTGRAESFVFGAKGRYPSDAYRSARLKSGFLSLTKAEPLSVQEFDKSFPEQRRAVPRRIGQHKRP